MGYFSNEDIIRKEYDREEITPSMNKEQCIRTILQAFPQKNYSKLVETEESTLIGMYERASQKLELQASKKIKNQMEMNLPIFDEEDEERRLGR